MRGGGGGGCFADSWGVDCSKTEAGGVTGEIAVKLQERRNPFPCYDGLLVANNLAAAAMVEEAMGEGKRTIC